MRLKTIGIIGLVFTLALVIIPAWGADFSTYTNKELESMRGSERRRFRRTSARSAAGSLAE